MSKLLQNIKSKTLELRKSKDSLGPTMQLHLSEIAGIAKTSGNDVTDDQVIQYLKSAVKKLEANTYSNQDEVELLNSYIPQMTPIEDVMEFVKTLDTDNKGVIMKAVRAKYGALVDMKAVSQNL